MRQIIRRYWPGPAFALLSVASSATYARLGPLPAGYNWAALALLVIVAGMMVLALFASLGRNPNPYSRTHPLYDLKDLPPEHRTLDSGSADLLWHLMPLATAVLILTFFARF
jgi:hypothetical protein